MIVQVSDSGNKLHPYGHALVAGIERYPQKITKRMSKTRQDKRSKVKPFIKTVNYNHLMPTRYTLELEGLKGVVSADTFKEVTQREEAKKSVKKVLEERYVSGKNRWFFTPLSMSTSLLQIFPKSAAGRGGRGGPAHGAGNLGERVWNWLTSDFLSQSFNEFHHLVGWAGQKRKNG